ncbi:hypothetical protein BLOT_013277 [Blomia tropicalis]|nr:hypothetical protein BLOT_013277 [Blomia tropicalis]
MYNIQPEYDRNSGNSLSSDTIVDNHHQTGREVNNRPLFNYGIHSSSTVTMELMNSPCPSMSVALTPDE